MLLGFNARFADRILDGTKIFTMRQPPKRMPKIGERLYMYSALRTKHTQKICDHHTLKSIQEVELSINKYSLWLPAAIKLEVDGDIIENENLHDFIISDGFKDLTDFVQYWIKGVKEDNYGCRRVKASLLLFNWTDKLIDGFPF